MSVESLTTMLNRAKTSDFSDVAELYQPSVQDQTLYSISPKDLIFNCAFDNENCDYRSFDSWKSKDYGTCYTFNSPFSQNSTNEKWPRTVPYSGPKHGLHVTLNIRSGLSILSPEVGVRVIIHSPHVLPVPEEEGFNVAPGTTSISISRETGL
ncbi:hypothetical protein SK128_009227 [Halocaridina rubra]|uniref:Uncharacterized protein n=1 Tax=Halocaridina rubra TaxID=373956 RepID=A0AAN8XLY8_HALRR